VLNHKIKGEGMPNYVNNICVICKNQFEVIYKKRNQKTCSKLCSYSLRSAVRKISHDPIKKACTDCAVIFLDTSKKKTVKKCKDCINKQMVDTRKKRGSYKRTARQNEKLSKTLKEKYENGWNPNTTDHKEKLAKLMKENWASGDFVRRSKKTCLKKYGVDHWMKTEEAKKYFSETQKNRVFSEETKQKMRISAAKRVRSGKETLFTNGNGCYRKDLKCYFRSNWEANFARICELNGEKWEYEPETFILKSGRTYTPDFKVENTLYEIKGRWIGDAKLKFEEFCNEYPTCKIELINGIIYKKLTKKYKHLIKNWEGK